jgi:RNA polymerase sigma factor (TIGR02999 family)
MSALPSEITRLLAEWGSGDPDALREVVEKTYPELRQIAARSMRAERSGHTLQPTALVHEAFLRLQEQTHTAWHNRAQFFAITATIMRRILVDAARKRLSQKGGGQLWHVAIDGAEAAAGARSPELLALDQALDRLARLDPSQAQLVELRYFAGFTIDEAAELLQVSPATVKREWSLARAWLHRELSSTRP